MTRGSDEGAAAPVVLSLVGVLVACALALGAVVDVLAAPQRAADGADLPAPAAGAAVLPPRRAARRPTQPPPRPSHALARAPWARSRPSPASATIALTADAPPTPRPRAYNRWPCSAVRLAISRGQMRPGSAIAATNDGPLTAAGVPALS